MGALESSAMWLIFDSNYCNAPLVSSGRRHIGSFRTHLPLHGGTYRCSCAQAMCRQSLCWTLPSPHSWLHTGNVYMDAMDVCEELDSDPPALSYQLLNRWWAIIIVISYSRLIERSCELAISFSQLGTYRSLEEITIIIIIKYYYYL